MTTKRTSKEYIINNNISVIKSKYGTLNRNNPDVLYVRSKTKIIANIDKKDYKDDLNNISNTMNVSIKNIIYNTQLFNRYISTFETPEKGLVYNKPSYLKYDVYLHPKIVKDLQMYENDITALINSINNVLKETCENYHIVLV